MGGIGGVRKLRKIGMIGMFVLGCMKLSGIEKV